MAEALERRLRELGRVLDYPPTPALASSVGRELRRAGRRPVRQVVPISRRKLAWAIAIAIVLLGGAALAAKLAIGALTVKIVPTPHGATPTAVETGPALGEPVTLAEARELVTFEIASPSGIRPPDRVSVEEFFDGIHVVMAWRDLPDLPRIENTPWDLVVFEFSGNEELAVKEVEARQFRFVRMDGAPGLWIHGPHVLVVRGESGATRFGVTGNVLAWSNLGVTIRIEADLPLADMLALAATFG